MYYCKYKRGLERLLLGAFNAIYFVITDLFRGALQSFLAKVPAQKRGIINLVELQIK